MSQEKFLANKNKKQKLIKFLCFEFNANGCNKTSCFCNTAVAENNADYDIERTAILIRTTNNEVIIIRKDIDLLLLLTQLSPTEKIYFMKLSKRKRDAAIYNRDSFKYPETKQYILFIHAIAGCDTTSCFYNQGKNRILKLAKNTDVQVLIRVFECDNAAMIELFNNGIELVKPMYTQSKGQNWRHYHP